MSTQMDDGFLEPAWVVRQCSLIPGNADFGLQNLVSSTVTNAACTGAFTCTVAIGAYVNALVLILMERLNNCGYTCSLSGTTLTVNWSVM